MKDTPETIEDFRESFPLNTKTYLHDGLTYNPKLIEWIKSYGQRMYLLGADVGIKETLPEISLAISSHNKELVEKVEEISRACKKGHDNLAQCIMQECEVMTVEYFKDKVINIIKDSK